jgi:hypothetical protein
MAYLALRKLILVGFLRLTTLHSYTKSNFPFLLFHSRLWRGYFFSPIETVSDGNSQLKRLDETFSFWLSNTNSNRKSKGEQRRHCSTLKRPSTPRLHGALMMEAVLTSETSVCSNDIARRYIPEGCQLLSRKQARLFSSGHVWRTLASQTFISSDHTDVFTGRSAVYNHRSVACLVIKWVVQAMLYNMCVRQGTKHVREIFNDRLCYCDYCHRWKTSASLWAMLSSWSMLPDDKYITWSWSIIQHQKTNWIRRAHHVTYKSVFVVVFKNTKSVPCWMFRYTFQISNNISGGGGVFI